MSNDTGEISEGVFNTLLRNVMRGQGLSTIHIRETDKPGATDLVVWKGTEIIAWAELKVDYCTLDTGQREFLRDRQRESGRAFVLRYKNATGLVEISQGSAQSVVARVPIHADWKKTFAEHSLHAQTAQTAQAIGGW